MKRWKRFFAGMLALAMAMSMMTMSVSATELAEGAGGDSGTGTGVTVPPPSTIDDSKSGKGSIIIHKYMLDTKSKDNGDDTLTYDESDGRVVTLPENAKAKPFPGVTFEIYKVEDIDFLKELYSGSGKELPTLEKYVTITKPVWVMDWSTGLGKWEGYSATVKEPYASKSCGTCITGNDGIATFSGLELGLYLVLETKWPASVTIEGELCSIQPACFLVSLPMTVDGSEWLYEVHAYPKNDVRFSNPVGLVKYGIAAGGDKLPLQGVTYALLKQQGDTWIPITKSADNGIENGGTDLILTTDENGCIRVENLTEGVYRLVERDLGTNHGYIIDGLPIYQIKIENGTWISMPRYETYTKLWNSAGTDYTWGYKEEDLWGMYMENLHVSPAESGGVLPERMSAVNEKPDITKKVQKSDGTWGKDAEYSVGDKIPYQVTASVPSKIIDMKTYNVTDVPHGLNDDISTITVKTEEGTKVAEACYTIEPIASTNDSGDGFKIVFTTAAMEDYAGKEIVINYEASLDPDKVSTSLEPDKMGNPNVVELEYSTNTGSWEGDPNPPDPNDTYIIQDKAIVYSFEFLINKFGEGTEKLSGVQFDLYREARTGETANVTEAEAGAAGLDTEKSWIKLNQAGLFGTAKEGDDAGKLETNGSGQKKVQGLANGHYTLVETKTQTGYNLLAKPEEFDVNVGYESVTTPNAEWTSYSRGEGKTDGWRLDKTSFSIKEGSSLKACELKIYNKKGFELPSTGGMGTFVFTFAGISMMTAAVILFITSKKKEAK